MIADRILYAKQLLRRKWMQEAVVGTEKTVSLTAQDVYRLMEALRQ